MVASEYGGGTNIDQDQIKLPLNHYTGIYAEDGTVNRSAKLSSLETAVSEHGCVADTDLSDYPIDLGNHIEDFGQYEQPSFTSHHSTGHNDGKHLNEGNSDMSLPLSPTPVCYLLPMYQDKMLVDTQFMVTSANSNASSVASFDGDLALTEQHGYKGPARLGEGEVLLRGGNHGNAAINEFELSTVDTNTEPVSHNDEDDLFHEGEEFVFAATYTEVRGCETDTTQEIQDSIKKLQSAPILSADHSQNLGESVPFPEICQAATLPWPHHDDDDGGPRAGPAQPPGGPPHAALSLPELEDSLGNADTTDKFDYGGSAPPDEMQELSAGYATETEDEFNEERSYPGMDINHPCFSWIFAKAEDKQEDSTSGSRAGYFTDSLSDESNSIVGSPLPKHDQQHVELVASQFMAKTSFPIAGSMSHSAAEMSADLFVVGDKLGPEENQINTGQDCPFYTMHEIGHAIEAEADAENKLSLSEHQPVYTEMSVAEYEEQQPQTEIGPTPVADIDFTSAIPLYER